MMNFIREHSFLILFTAVPGIALLTIFKMFIMVTEMVQAVQVQL